MNTYALRGIHFLYALIIRPKSGNEDSQRHEFILNIILSGTIILVGIFLVSLIGTWVETRPDYTGTPPLLFATIWIFFVALLVLSRRGFFKAASYILIAVYYLAITYAAFNWGVELPLAALGYVIVIVIASILISTRFGFFVTIGIGATVILLGHLQINGITQPALFWKSDMIRFNDPIELAVIFLLIMTMSWLSNREIESSLKRARRSEHELKIERDLLEIRVEERTRELKDAQIEKTAGLYRMAEFGRLSSGLFHDLMTPLQGVVAGVSDLQEHSGTAREVKEHLDKAVAASKRMANFLGAIRKQINPNEMNQVFSLNQELQEAVDILGFKARTARVAIHIKESAELFTFGNPLKFHQIAVNLLSNAIDACEGHGQSEPAIIHAKLVKFEGRVLFKVSDSGCGVPQYLIEKIFDPFFTTKSAHRGMGLGLSTTKSIVEKDFGGTISVASIEGRGTTFTILFPFRKEEMAEKIKI